MDTGEKCGQGTLAKLQNQAVEKYGSAGNCNDVYGNPSDEQQVSLLANTVLDIIREEQESKANKLR